MSRYDDIIDLPAYHDPSKPYMPASGRAAQFVPFKSLNGYHEEIDKATGEANDVVWEDIEEFPVD